MNTIITSTWDIIIQEFSPIFTVPMTEIFINLITGGVFCTAKHNITGTFSFADTTGKKAHDAYYSFYRMLLWTGTLELERQRTGTSGSYVPVAVFDSLVVYLQQKAERLFCSAVVSG